MRFFLLETKWWHPHLSAQHLHPLLNWITYQISHIFLCRQLQSSMGRAETCSLLWRETGYFARCMVLGLVILLCVRPGRIFSWCQLSFCVPCGVLWSLLYWLTLKFYATATLLLGNLGQEGHPLSLLLSSLVKISDFFLFCTFLRNIPTAGLPLMGRTGLDDLKWSLLVL